MRQGPRPGPKSHPAFPPRPAAASIRTDTASGRPAEEAHLCPPPHRTTSPGPARPNGQITPWAAAAPRPRGDAPNHRSGAGALEALPCPDLRGPSPGGGFSAPGRRRPAPRAPLTASLRRFGRSSSTTLSPGFSAPLEKASWSCGEATVRPRRRRGGHRAALPHGYRGTSRHRGGGLTSESERDESSEPESEPESEREPRRAMPLPLWPPPFPAACARRRRRFRGCRGRGCHDDGGGGGMSAVTAQPVAVFGCRPRVAGGVCFVEDQVVLHAAGAGCLQLHLEQKWHKFIPGGPDPGPGPPTPAPDPRTPDPDPGPGPPCPDPSPSRRHREEPGRAGAGRQPQPAVPGRLRDGGGAAGPDRLRAVVGAGAAAEDAGRRRAAGAGGGGPGLLPRLPVPGGRHGPPRGAPHLLAVGEAAADGGGPPRGPGQWRLPGKGRGPHGLPGPAPGPAGSPRPRRGTRVRTPASRTELGLCSTSRFTAGWFFGSLSHCFKEVEKRIKL